MFVRLHALRPPRQEGADEGEPLPNRLAVERKTAASTDKQASLHCSS
jgi:hypothetical protein